MNRTKDDSKAHAVRARVLDAGADRLWTYADFSDMLAKNVDRMALAAELSRLTKRGELTRIRRGVYYRPRMGVFGATRPDPVALADATLRTRGETAVPTGMSVYNRLGFTTQLSNTVARATTHRVPSGLLRENGVRLYTVRRPVAAQKGITPAERAALDAMRDVGRIPGSTPAGVVSRMATLIKSKNLDYARLARFALVEPPRVRALLGAIGDGLRNGDGAPSVAHRSVDNLKASLNPLTSYSIPGLRGTLRTAMKWRIT